MKLTFEEDAIRAIAKQAFERKTGARGLRSIMEKVMMDVMFNIPSDDTIEECVITKEAVAWAVGYASPERIDEINILQATYEAMREAIGKLTPATRFLINPPRSRSV